jgi:ribose-phosphate pyrophosphokinase
MVRNIVILAGSSHPAFVEKVAGVLGVAPSSRVLTKFSSGETRCEIRDSVRGKDVYIVQSFGTGDDGSNEGGLEGEGPAGSGQKHTVNDYFIELCIMISACKTGSAKRVTAVLPMFPYSRQPDLPFSKVGAPLVSMSSSTSQGQQQQQQQQGKGAVQYTFESVPATPGPNIPRTVGLGTAGVDVVEMIGAQVLMRSSKEGNGRASPAPAPTSAPQQQQQQQQQQQPGSYTTHDYENPALMMALQAKPGHKQFMAQSGSLVADLLTCAGADRILTCDLHESAYQGFFDIPGMFFYCFMRLTRGAILTYPAVDNLHARPLLKRYIQQNIPNYRDAVIVSPDAGGAKRATAIADSLGLAFALIHKGLFFFP